MVVCARTAHKRNRNFSQCIALIKCTFSDILYTVRYFYRFYKNAESKCPFSDFFHAVRKGDILQRGAAIEGAVADFGHIASEIQAFCHITIEKSLFSDGINTDRNINLRQSTTAGKCLSTDIC